MTRAGETMPEISTFEDARAAVAGGTAPTVAARALMAHMTRDEMLRCLDGDVPAHARVAFQMDGGYHRSAAPAAHVDRLGIPGIAGRLPFSVPVDESHLPAFDRDATSFRYDRWHGWAHLARIGETPAYPSVSGCRTRSFARGCQVVRSSNCLFRRLCARFFRGRSSRWLTSPAG